MPKRQSYAGRYADYFNHSDTSDVKVVIEVAQSASNLARRQLQLQDSACNSADAGELRAHSMTLMANSPVWKAQLERWQDTHKRKTMTMIVEGGEQAAAHMLIQCLYTDSLREIETEADLRMTLGILMLAHQYQVQAALALCEQNLETVTNLGAITWELADNVMQLPAAYLENDGISCLVVKIQIELMLREQEKILQHAATEPSLPSIGLDLEVVMRNSKLKEVLMTLPLHKCASLLSDDQCRIASENTVAAAVVRHVKRDVFKLWHSTIGWNMGDVVRVPHLSPLFAAAMPTFGSEPTTLVRPEIYALGRELGGLPAELRGKVSKDLSIPRCWLSPPRPSSTVTALEFDWDASTAELAEKFDSGAQILARSPSHFFAGLDWEVTVQRGVVPDNEGCTVGIFFAGKYPLKGGFRTEGPHYGATTSIDILAHDMKSLLHRHCLHIAKGPYGWADFFNIPPMQKWDESRMEQWTSSKDVLSFRVKVSNVL